ncbi:MAG: D-alanyl-D-alanine carboxypeptidase/D-alanyl-D-alanine-endopeptidase, partial [Nitrosomonas sp. PRO5]|nr:D-alanyl-D-alanine carboxypeptidase/D-alanyl-D-alanine-endopeptidase [Nitrosomonas sp. PRO5]
MKSFLKVAWLLWGVLIFPAYAVDLPDTVRQALKKAGIPESAVGVYVREVG